MSDHYTYLKPITEDPNTQKAIMGLAAAAIFLGAGWLAARKIQTKKGLEDHINPGKFSLTAFFDLCISGFINYFDSMCGKEKRKYASLAVTVFFYILFLNFLGLVPGMPAATTTVWINVGMALVVFFSFNWFGIKEQGFVNYIKHFAGPIPILALFLFPLEIVSLCMRILTLNLRLYWNISADHIVLGVFTDLTKYVVPVIFYGLGTFVAFMQAFVFATLTMVYIFLATDHGGEENHH